ncbi:MAG: two-component system nitrogen regulation response regulator NtrX [Gammaproteobacteria bacterium]|jgi:two-component system nitrogen regulation response regulator NtrX
MSASHILVVDDEPDIRELIKDILDDEGYEVTTAENAQAARDARRNRKPDMVLLDIWMPDTDGISLLREWNDDDSHFALPVVMMSGHGTVETAVEATRLGAYDFLEKPLSMAKLLITVRRALENAQLKAENVGLRRDAANQSDPLGRSATMNDIRERAKRIGRHDTAVLISGESGSGKAVLARYIHNQSARSNSPFVRVPVSGLTNARSAAELFGVENNGAVHYGLLEQSNGGTLFLEDIVDMDLEVQAIFLSALTQNAFLRVGALESTPIDVRIIAATSHDAALAVRDGRLREDLYYHLNVVPLDVPALRDHREDVPELIEYFVEQLVQHENLPYRRFGVAAQNRLRHYTWPGNVRELKNVVQRLLILSAGEEVQAQDVDIALGGTAQSAPSPRDADFELPLKEARERFERRYLEHRIREEQGNISRVAERVGVERTHLYRKFKSLQLDPKQILNDG